MADCLDTFGTNMYNDAVENLERKCEAFKLRDFLRNK
jgi:hypothetical protein